MNVEIKREIDGKISLCSHNIECRLKKLEIIDGE